MPRGMGEKIGSFYVKAPIGITLSPGQSSTYQLLAAKVIPPLCSIDEIWLNVEGMQTTSDEITARGYSTLRLGAVNLGNAFDFNPNAGGGDLTNDQIVQLFDNTMEGMGDPDDVDKDKDEELGDNEDPTIQPSSRFWINRMKRHSFKEMLVTEANKGRHWFTFNYHLRNPRVLDDMADGDAPNMLAAMITVGIDPFEGNTDVSDAICGDKNPDQLYRLLLLHMGAYRTVGAAQSVSDFSSSEEDDTRAGFNIMGGDDLMDTDLRNYLSLGINDTDGVDLEQDFLLTGRLTARCGLYAGQRSNLVTVQI